MREKDTCHGQKYSPFKPNAFKPRKKAWQKEMFVKKSPKFP